jgi:transcriptional regulator with XRE-family HTH domain
MRTARTWTPSELSLLGTDADDAVAKRLGVSRGTVNKKREELGIPPCHERGYRTQPFATWLSAAIRDAGYNADEAAELFRVSPETLSEWLTGSIEPSKLEKSGIASLLLSRRANLRKAK